MQARAKRHVDGGACFVAEWGTCGGLRYLDEVKGGMEGRVRYYDERERLVAVAHYNIEHGGMFWDGPPQACSRKRSGDFCAKRQ